MTKFTSAILMLTLSSCLVSKKPPARVKFAATTIKSRGMLMREIDKLQWRIGYNFTADCPAAFRQQEKKLQGVIVEALQTWLQPLRARYPNRRFTDDFLLLRQPDVEKCGEDRRALAQLDTRITSNCRAAGAGSYAVISAAGTAPDLCMKAPRGIDWGFFPSALVHELGHAFGMDDTYTRRNLVSTGGLARTMGKQPSSMMSGGFPLPSMFQLGEDDKNGIIWLYRYLHEGHPAGDCFFPDYVPAGHDGNCRPQYPLMFEVRHGSLHAAQQILRDDPTLDHNARDTGGNTALHYTVQRGQVEIVTALLAQAGIKVNITNKKGRTPAQLARLIKRLDLARLIEAHPTAKLPPWSVKARGKKAVTWGELKRGRQ